MWKTAAVGALGVAALCPASWAQAGQETAAADPLIDRVVVVGSRGAPRRTTDTPAPVDVFSGEELAEAGFSDLTKVLQFLSPSFNYPRAASGPSTQGARPATLRGLGPDQVLVLINGHRRHASSLITFNNTVGRGTVPADYNMIPISAVERIEVLRDGAAAQYGSDAIAGVINIVLRDDSDGGLVSVQYGQTENGDGETFIAAGRKGLALGEDGFLTVSGEVRDRGDTNAAEIDPRFGRVTSHLGDSPATDINIALNAEAGLGGDVRAYGFLTLGRRESEMSPLFRAPTVAPAFYPNGFLPIVNLELDDIGGTAGLRGYTAGWDWSLSNTIGYSSGDYSASNTVNTSLGLTSPTRFYGGGARYAQNLINVTVGREFDLAAGAHLSAGLEHRFEAYELVKGDVASYTLAGAQGFPGFNPARPVDVDRDAFSAFLDGEISPIEGLDLGVAVRHESYSDFGEKTTGKASAFWRPIDFLAARATTSTGFRAPSLQQQYFSTVTSQLLPGGQLSNVGNFAVSDPVSVALGASPLKPETSVSYSGGVMLTPLPNLSLSIDAYRIDIEDRISLSENIQGPQVTAILVANGITNASVARFFTNAADTRSEGLEVTMRWEQRLAPDARLTVTAAYGSFDTDTTRLASNPVLPQIALLGAASINVMTDAQPRNKTMLDLALDWGDWRFNAAATDFGSVRSPTAAGGVTLAGKTTIDVSARWQATDMLSLTFGVLNAADEYPSRIPGEGTGRPYSEADPIGFNGREYFAKLAMEF